MALTSTPSANSNFNVDQDRRSWSIPLYKSLNQGNWEAVKAIIGQHPEAITARLTQFDETPLLVAVKAGQGLPFIRKLLHFMPPEALALTDSFGDTALHAVALAGNIHAARLFVERNRDLPTIGNTDGDLPVHLAAMRGHREMTMYLLSVNGEDGDGDLAGGAAAAKLLRFAITSEFYDLGLSLVEGKPGLAWQHHDENFSPLELLAEEPSAFPSGMDFNIWQLFIYSCVPKKLIEIPDCSLSGSTTRHCRNQFSRACQELHVILWKVIETLAKPLQLIRATKFRHYQVLRLMKRVCSEITCSANAEAASILKEPFLLAARNGIHEIVEEILESFPQAMTFLDGKGRSVFQLAVLCRREKIFKIARQQREQYNASLLQLVDRRRNNILHLAARIRPPDRLKQRYAGAVLMMQRELQWFTEVEKFVLPQQRKSMNADYRTPLELFDEEHRYLVESETQWMIGMATSCTVAASLIAAVAFAAAITVPGGNSSNGLPIFSSQKAFLLFVIADALALLSSITTVLAFLSIFTTRYSVNDFLYALPNRLIIGLISLFLSVTSLMVAFGSTMFLVAAQSNSLILVPIVALACVPVALFAYLQLPPLLNMIKSTYGPSIFN